MPLVDGLKPRWTEASFLLYAGGLTVLGSAVGSLVYLGRSYSDGGLVLWTLLILVILYAIAHGFRIRDRWIAAGMFAFASVIAWAAFVYALWAWFGWLHSTSFAHPFEGFSLARLSFVLLVLAASIDDRRRFRFPFISAITVVARLVLRHRPDLGRRELDHLGDAPRRVDLPRRRRGNGLAFVVLVEPRGRRPDRGALLDWWHVDDLDYALISVFALLFVAIAYGTRRSSWAVLATIGFFLAGYHFAKEWSSETVSVTGVTNVRDWVPYAVFAFVGFLLVALGSEEARHRRGRARAPRRSGYAPIRLTP